MLRWLSTGVFLAALMACGGDNAEKYLQAEFAGFQRQRYDEAIANYQKAIKLQPRTAAAYNMMGLAYRFKYNKVGGPEFRQKEMAAFEKAVEIDPKNWVALVNLGTDYYTEGQKAKAAPLFKKALELNPGHPEKLTLQKMIEQGEAKP
jgi:tetratricopeptide (TPR) repeat protein